jgi:hypothetical protein
VIHQNGRIFDPEYNGCGRFDLWPLPLGVGVSEGQNRVYADKIFNAESEYDCHFDVWPLPQVVDVVLMG